MDDGKFHSDKVRDSCSEACSYKPTNMHIVKILLNDQLGKLICLHAKFKDSLDQDAIVLLQKTPFPNKVQALCEAHLGRPFSECEELEEWEMRNGSKASLVFPEWKADRVTDNEIYHRRLVKAGLEDLNTLNMTVIHPAGPHHFVKYTASGRRLVLETPELYADVVVPFLEARPPDLAWVDNVLNGTAEVDRVLFADPDKSLGFVLAIDFRWDLRQLNELHCLALARSASLTCLRDLRAYHLPMMKKMLSEGRRALVAKYGRDSGSSSDYTTDTTEGRATIGSTALSEDQIFAYFHYPPTFYRLHMHFAHVDCAPDGGTQTGRAYLAEDVIANLEQDGEFYARRTMPIFLRENQPLLAEIQRWPQQQRQPKAKSETSLRNSVGRHGRICLLTRRSAWHLSPGLTLRAMAPSLQPATGEFFGRQQATVRGCTLTPDSLKARETVNTLLKCYHAMGSSFFSQIT